MCHLLMDNAIVVQQMAFSIIRPAAASYAEHIVVEAAVDTSEENQIELTIELLELLRKAYERESIQDDDSGVRA